MAEYRLLNSSQDLFEKLKFDLAAFTDDTSSTYKGMDSVYSAWHLADWVFEEFEKPTYYSHMNHGDGLGKMRIKFFAECDALRVMHDIANGSKHMVLTSTKSDMSGSRTSEESIYSDVYTDEYPSDSHVMIEFGSGEAKSLLSLLELTVAFWGNYLLDK